MAAFRRIITCLRGFSRTVPLYESSTVSTLHRQHYFKQWHVTVPTRSCSVPATSSKQKLETLLNKGSVDEVLSLRNDQTDVYIFGFPFNSSKAEVETFFEGLNIEEICYLDLSRHRMKEMYYVRFKDEDSKTKALELNGKYMGKRYVTVHPVAKVDPLGYCILWQRSDHVILENLPFESDSRDILEWIKPVETNTIVFMQRGTCFFKLGCEDVEKILARDYDKMDGRPIRVKSFIPRDDLGNFRQKFCS